MIYLFQHKETPIMVATRGDKREVFEALIRHGADVNYSSEVGD